MAKTREITEGTRAADPIGDRHLAGCPADPSRTEVYENQGPAGYVKVTRCADCAAQVAGDPTPEPTLEEG